MALTQGTTAPIIPYGGRGGTSQAATVLSVPYTSSNAIKKGDILVLTSGLAISGNNNQSDATVLGVAMEAKASTAGLVFKDQVLIAAALPGALFSGSFVGGAATDYTANTVTHINGRHDSVLGTDAYSAFILVDQSTTATGQLNVFQFANEQLNGNTFTFSGTTIKNPRVIFSFRSSIFQPLA